MSLLPPGRFLMPGNLAGSPALTFAPLQLPAGGTAPDGSLWAMMRRRYEAYKDVVVRPFFRDHFSRLDRQVVLVDALAAFNAGPEALHDLEAALAGILDCFRIGRSTLLSSLFRPRIDRILFAATKADHLHHSSHDRLERCCGEPWPRPRPAPNIPAPRSTSWHWLRCARPRGPGAARSGKAAVDPRTPAADTRAGGQGFDGETFDGETEVATFPGDLPEDPEELFRGEGAFRGLSSASAEKTDFRFLRFRPPQLESQDAAVPSCLTSASTAPSSS